MTKQTPQGIEYNKFAFRTEKGIFTLVGTESPSRNKTIDTFRHIGTSDYYTWERQTIHSWVIEGKIQKIDEATRMDWHTNNRNQK